VYSTSSVNVWDDGYPSGGNYWSDYTGLDQKCGPGQNHSGSDGMGDTPYVIDSNNQDGYPLMNPWTPPAGHNIAVVSVVSSKTVICQGFSGNITVYGANKGEYSETFNVTVYANTTSIASMVSPLESSSTTSITFSWNTSGFVKGNYTISAYAEPVPGETDTTDNTFVDGWVKVVVPGNVNGDEIVDTKDITTILRAYGTIPGHPNYNPNADVNCDGVVDMKDVTITLRNYGKTEP
jgi:hypothetical protein